MKQKMVDAKSSQLLTSTLLLLELEKARASAMVLDRGSGHPQHPRLDLGLIFLPPAAPANAFQQHKQAFCMVETRLYTIGKPHQRAVAAAVALKIELNSIG